MSSRKQRRSARRAGLVAAKPADPPKRHPPAGIPPASTKAAKAAFANFNLATKSRPVPSRHYVAPGQSVMAAHRAVIASTLSAIEKQDTSRSLTLALPAATIQQLLPSYNPTKGTLLLDDLLTVVQSNMRGTEFYATTNPTLNRLSVRSQLDQLFAAIKSGGTP